MLIDMLTSLAISGSAAAAACLLLRWLSRGRLSARWEDWMVRLSLVFALVPLGQLFSLVRELLTSLPAAAGNTPAPVLTESALPGTAVAPVLPVVPEITGATAPGGTLVLPRWVLALAAGIWLLGAAWLLVRKLRTRKALWRLVHTSRPVTEETILETLRHCCALLGLHCPVAVRASAAVSSPLVTGVLRPVVLLPETHSDPEALKCLLLHELDHIRRGDLWVRLCAMTALILHWYNPLFHMLDRTVREVEEERCDEDVAGLLNRRERLRYGRLLLQMAAGNPGDAGPWALCLSSREALERRLKKMLHIAPMNGRRRFLALLAAAAVLTCGTAAALSAGDSLVTAAPEISAAVQTAPQAEKTPAETEPSEAAVPAAEPLPEETVSPQETPAETAAQMEEPVSQPEDAVQTPAPQAPAVSDELRVIMETAVRGDPELIASRGGTLLPDDDLSSYAQINGVWYKYFITKNEFCGAPLCMAEYFVSNPDTLDTDVERPLLNTLVNDQYPVNSRGESYGDRRLCYYVGYLPDLIAVGHSDGQQSYISRADEEAIPSLSAQECPHEFTIPLYDSEHNVIGEYSMSCGGHFSGGTTIEEAKEALAAGEDLA